MKLLTSAILKVNALDRDKCLEKESKDTESVKNFFLITQYNPSLPDIKDIIREIWEYADRSSST